MNVPDPLMSIGMFSRASLVSVKALRAYHEQGLLIPDSVDPVTGYRSYRVSQLPEAQVIKRLRDLDVPLRDVATVMAASDPEITRKVMAEHETIMRERLAEVTRIVEDLQQARERPSRHTPVHLRTEPATHALAVTGEVDGADYASFLGDAYGRLWTALSMVGSQLSGSSAALYPPAVEAEREDVVAYLPISDGPGPLPEPVLALGVTLTLVPSVTGAVLTHVGSYDTIGDSYRQLGAWVAGNATSAELPVRELYVVSVDERGELLPDHDLQTEIVWPGSAALDRPVDEGPPEPSPFFASIGRQPNGNGDDDGGSADGVALMFIQVPESKEGKNRVHLDLVAEDREAEVERLVSLGATRVHDKDEWGIRWTTLADPEGNELCIAEH